MTRIVYSNGNIQAGAWDQIWIPNELRNGVDTVPVVLLHGSHYPATTMEMDAPNWPGTATLAAVLAQAGIPVVEGHMGGNTYANDAACAPGGYVDDALAYAAARTGCSADRIHLIGWSMGGALANRFASLNPGKAASVQGFIPLTNMYRIYTENPLSLLTGGFTNLISTAWGLHYRTFNDATTTNGSAVISSPALAAFTAADVGRHLVTSYGIAEIPEDVTIVSVESATSATMSKPALGTTGAAINVAIADPLPYGNDDASANLVHHAGNLAASDIPSRWFYAPDDVYIPQTDVEPVATAAGGALINLGTGGHSDQSSRKAADLDGGENWSAMVQWLVDRS